jgi:LPS-assembly lipoprotein
MWWFKTSAAVVAIFALTALGSCGFQPLYGERASSVSNRALSEVRIKPLRDRSGQLLYTHLTKGLHARGLAKKPLWELAIALKKRSERLGIRSDETATRINLTLEAIFQLKNLRTGQVTFKGRSVTTNSYNILDSRFATIASEQNAIERATRVLGDNIKTRVAIFLAGTKRGG